MSWLRSFFAMEHQGIVRSFTLSEYLHTGQHVEIGTDASPWSMGGWYAVGGAIVKYFACPVIDDDLGTLEIERGSCTGQQALEGLAILVAMRLWCDHKDARKVHLSVRGDNIGALTLLIKMRPKSPAQALISRELALITVRSAFPPQVVHTPGLAHVVADLLSRMNDPRKAESGVLAHPALRNASRTEVPQRDRLWYRTLAHASPQGSVVNQEGDPCLL